MSLIELDTRCTLAWIDKPSSRPKYDFSILILAGEVNKLQLKIIKSRELLKQVRVGAMCLAARRTNRNLKIGPLPLPLPRI